MRWSGMRPPMVGPRRAVAAVVLFGVAVLLGACRGPLVVETSSAHEAPGAGDGPEREWTVAVYMSGDNELEAQALADLSEMEAADLGGAPISVVVLLDRAEGYDPGAGDWSGTRLYEVEPDPLGDASSIASRRLSSPRLGIESDADVELNTGDPRTLARFLAFVAAEYPAPKTALVVWGPGAGYGAVSVDDGNGGDPLATVELAEALETHPPDIVALDLAFGAQIEIAREIDRSAQSLIASQQTVGTSGWDYTRFLEALAAAPDDRAGSKRRRSAPTPRPTRTHRAPASPLSILRRWARVPVRSTHSAKGSARKPIPPGVATTCAAFSSRRSRTSTAHRGI